MTALSGVCMRPSYPLPAITITIKVADMFDARPYRAISVIGIIIIIIGEVKMCGRVCV